MGITLKTLILNLCILVVCAGCVGAIKSANSISTNSKTTSNIELSNFSGIESAVAIADSKVDVFFPVVTGDLSKYSFVIRYSGQSTPIYVAATQVNSIEHLNSSKERVISNKVTISGLNVSTYYEFSVELRNVSTGKESTSNKLVRVKTFPNMTAQFNGITEVRNLPGSLGVNGIKVSWVEAEVRGSTISKNEVDPIYYVVTVLDGSTPGIAKNPTQINDITINDSSRSLIYVDAGKNNVVISGLRANTQYYVQVRALHYGYSNQASNVNDYKVEENINYKTITTYSQSQIPTLSNSIKTSFLFNYPSGSAAFSSVNLLWNTPVGVFDHYRIYFDTSSSYNTSSCNSSNCQKVSADQTSTSVVGLSSNTTYILNLVVCIDSTCSNSLAYNPITYTTTPPDVDNYTGILSIDTATSLETLDQLTLNLGVPDFTSGYIAGVDIFGCHSSSTSNCNPDNNTNLLTSSTSLALDPSFDYTINNTLNISGIDSTSPNPYCFLAKPYVWKSMVKTYTNAQLSSVKCKVPTILAPSFAGFNTDSTCSLLVWNRPNNGIFDAYEIYYREKNTAEQSSLPLTLDLDSNGNPFYQTVIINSNLTQYSMSNLSLNSGKFYDFGIRTLYRSSAGTSSWIRSNNITIESLKKCGPY